MLSLLFFGLLGQSFDPFKERNDIIKQNRIKQRVKIERMYVYPVDEKGRVSKKGQLRSEEIYNESGKSIKSSSYFPNMTIINETEYNDKGLETKMTSKNGAGQIRQTLMYEYDGNDKLIKVRYYDPRGKLSTVKDIRDRSTNDGSTSFNDKGEVTAKTESKYDSAARTYTSVLLSPSGDLKYQNQYWFNELHQIVEWSVIDNVQNKRFVTKYKYDERGNEVEKHTYSIDGQPTQKFLTTYNDKNLEVENVWYEPYDKKKQISRYAYEYQ
jgi:YD repeat-containing protein